MNMLTIQDHDVSDFMFKAWRTAEPLTEMEEFRLSRAAFQRFRHGDMAFFQFQRGAIA
jgi:hypothetical protein